MSPQPHFYENLLVFFYAIDEINKNPTMLLNITLGYHLYDSCGENRKALINTLEILSGPGKTFPNYSCRGGKEILGFIGDQSSGTTATVAQILAMYHYVQLIEFLSYTDDNLSLSFIAITLLFCILTFLIMGIFISYGDTPIVRANNKSLSFVLLVTISLGFLCVFLFLGRPMDTTCRLRQVSFGILFTIAVSCVLAKTVMVWLAFKATKPGSVWKQWVGVKLPNLVVFICSSFQVVICIVWLAISPPFPELDTRSYQTKIIIQCNEGSVVGFYSVLGYMGILAAVSFITAFLARTLPDSFNEAKYITFSMLVFCSVWIAMIPAYLSTKGKYVAAVEIFAILTSNAGLLFCIFLPKCYIIICHPNLNSKKHLLDNRGK
ncbi:PREDICTED: vomeronasal type-2 receptor 26-like [Nanorana parkeri]|uniref:vomeronasal type-2 receptor 26-like n=1 Tax=Nanorana parkeri TaxID=125878 RepID=UPI000854AF2B|nr:PREDICTED: vomeronasal type-2 receptor 26-like [Nanorana parkeri]